MKSVEYVYNVNTSFLYTNFSIKCRLFQPPKLKTVGGDAFSVAEMHFFRGVYGRLKMG